MRKNKSVKKEDKEIPYLGLKKEIVERSTTEENMLEYNHPHYSRGDTAHDLITDIYASPSSVSFLQPLYIPLHPSLPISLTFFPLSPVLSFPQRTVPFSQCTNSLFHPSSIPVPVPLTLP